jgi:hypothetical protein
MILGVDFDNTIVCYDQVFHRAAIEQDLIPPEIPEHKEAVRDYLRGCGQEETWTALQGYVYGARMLDAEPFPGVKECLAHCIQEGITVSIISHRTRYPYLGYPYDLHQAAHEWLDAHGFFDPALIGLLPERVFFELTKQAKLSRISLVGCTHFIDDLPEFLGEPNFPSGIERILFYPNGKETKDVRFRNCASWKEIEDTLSHDRMF